MFSVKNNILAFCALSISLCLVAEASFPIASNTEDSEQLTNHKSIKKGKEKPKGCNC